jgi:hypothetical protein
MEIHLMNRYEIAQGKKYKEPKMWDLPWDDDRVGFVDFYGNDLKWQDKVYTFDSRGKRWDGIIVLIQFKDTDTHPFKAINRPLYGFMSNYLTWINDQKYASTLRKINEQV